jgi:hypothetical protein
LELEMAKQIIEEIFHTWSSDVEEMIQKHILEEKLELKELAEMVGSRQLSPNPTTSLPLISVN